MLWPTIDLANIIQQTNHKFFTLAFIVSGPVDKKPSWGGVIPLEQKFYMDQVNKIRNLGGDIIISFGGLNGLELAQTTTDINELVKMYQNVIDMYGLKYVDFDIEGGALSEMVSIDRRNKAIKILQQNNPKLKIAYCLPVTPEGLSLPGFNLLKNAKENDVRVDVVNIMTMCYGEYYSKGKDLGILAVDASKSTYNQIQSIGYTNTKVGVTPMIGMNDLESEIFTLDNAKYLTEFASKTSWVSLLSNWSLNRDNSKYGPLYISTRLQQNDYDFLNILRKFQDSSSVQPQAPVPVPVPVPVSVQPQAPVPVPVPVSVPAPVPVPVSVPAPVPAPVPVPVQPSSPIQVQPTPPQLSVSVQPPVSVPVQVNTEVVPIQVSIPTNSFENLVSNFRGLNISFDLDFIDKQVKNVKFEFK